MIIDAGGGTIDVSVYAKTPKCTFEEIAAPECLSCSCIMGILSNPKKQADSKDLCSSAAVLVYS
jgi:hypothetical protein